MLRKSCLYFLVIVLVVVFNTTVFAAEENMSVTASFDQSSGMITLSGTAYGNIIIRVVPYNTDLSVLSDANLPLEFDQIYNNGKLDYSFKLNPEVQGGKYTVYVSNENETKSDTFPYINIEAAKSIVPTINQATNVEELKSISETNSANLGIDITDVNYIEKSESIYNLLLTIRRTYTDPAEFYSDFYQAYAMANMNGSSDENIRFILEKYAAQLGISYSNDFENDDRLTDEIKSELCSLLSCVDFNRELQRLKNDNVQNKFGTLFEELKLLSAIRKSINWMDIEKAVTIDYKNVSNKFINRNPDYSSITTKSNIFIKMMGLPYNTYNDIVTNFNEAINKVNLEIISNNQQSNSGSVGGGVGGVMSVPPSASIDKGESQQLSELGEASYKPVILNPEAKSSFSDIEPGYWSFVPISALNESGVIGGYEDNTFRPFQKITRAEFAKLICSAIGLVSDNQEKFNDVPEGQWYNEFVGVAASVGLIKGYNGSFMPEMNITREDAAVIIYRTLNLCDIKINGTAKFDDNNSISVYAITAVGALYKSEIMLGYDNNLFMPKSEITREEAAQIIYNALQTINK